MERILLVDDNVPFRKMLCLKLKRLGYEVVEASDGREALRAFSPETVTLVITDMVMPEMEGLETILELKRIYAGVRIVAMSGGGRNRPDDYLKMAKSLGAESVLTKPFSDEALKAALAGPASSGKAR